MFPHTDNKWRNTSGVSGSQFTLTFTELQVGLHHRGHDDSNVTALWSFILNITELNCKLVLVSIQSHLEEI